MSRCEFTKEYYDYEIGKYVDFNCPEQALSSGLCIFHDKDHIQDKTNNEEHKRKVLDRLKEKVNHVISYSEPLLCIGFHLPDFSLSDLSISKEFTKPAYFNDSQVFGKADFSRVNFQGAAEFSRAKFQGGTSFIDAKFQGKADFSDADFHEEANFNHSEFYAITYFSGCFNGETKFHYVLFEGKEKVIFKTENLSNVSFMNTDITGVRFSDNARWGGKKAKEDRFKILDERLLEEKIKEKESRTTKDFNLGSIKAVYRSIRENYEYIE